MTIRSPARVSRERSSDGDVATVSSSPTTLRLSDNSPGDRRSPDIPAGRRTTTGPPVESSSPMDDQRVVIVGGGVIGTMHALEGVRRGWEVVHLEADAGPRRASVRK